MAKDFIHSQQVVERVVAILRQQLPDDWTSDLPTDVAVTAIQPGDLRDFPIDDLVKLSPIILVRSDGVQPSSGSGLGGVRETAEIIRVVLIRAHEDCTDTDGTTEQNMCRARYRYAKELWTATFSDPHSRLALIDGSGNRTPLSLNSDDTAGAQATMCQFVQLDYGGKTDDTRSITARGDRVWSIALDMAVVITNGGEHI